MGYYGSANTHKNETLKERTIRKMERSRKKKREILWYLWEHKRHLLRNPNKREKLKHCANELKFVKDPETWYEKLYSGGFCKYHTFCLACATRRALLQLKKFEKMIVGKKLQKKHRYFIVLTFRTTRETTLKDAMSQVMEYRTKISQN